MAQSALNDDLPCPLGEWTKISEINCTFQVVSGKVRLLGTSGGTAPTGTNPRGVVYEAGEGEAAATDTLARFTGAGTANGLYVIPDGSFAAVVFVSRAAVA
jgi:hypothetical protein